MLSSLHTSFQTLQHRAWYLIKQGVVLKYRMWHLTTQSMACHKFFTFCHFSSMILILPKIKSLVFVLLITFLQFMIISVLHTNTDKDKPVENSRTVFFHNPADFSLLTMLPTASSIQLVIPAYVLLFSSLIKLYGLIYSSGTCKGACTDWNGTYRNRG